MAMQDITFWTTPDTFQKKKTMLSPTLSSVAPDKYEEHLNRDDCHHNLVVMTWLPLLEDGCLRRPRACAGPYWHYALGIARQHLIPFWSVDICRGYVYEQNPTTIPPWYYLLTWSKYNKKNFLHQETWKSQVEWGKKINRQNAKMT